MTVCKFFLQGTCKFGDRCRFEHPFNGQGGYRSNQQPFGARQQLNFSNNSTGMSAFGGGSKNVTFGNQQQQPPTVQEILNTISQEMEVWEKSKMWPFSCFGYQKGVKSFPGLEDHSMEEVRLKAYEAQQSGGIDQHKQWLAHLMNDYTVKRQELKRPSNATKQKMVSLIDDLNRQLAASEKGPTANTTGTVFGQSASSGSRTTGLFGKSTVTGQSAFPSTNPNQSPMGGGVAGTQSAFGGGGSVFGGSSAGTQPVFGGSGGGAQSVFGGSTAPTQSVFGGGAGSSPAVFGGSSAPLTQATFGTTSAFGGGASQTTGAQSAFGAAAVFGSSQRSATTQHSGAGASSSGVFGQASQPQSQPTGLFGKPAATTGSFSASPSGTGIFAQPSQAPVPNQNTGTFGATAVISQANQALGGQTQAGTTLFGKPFQMAQGTTTQMPQTQPSAPVQQTTQAAQQPSAQGSQNTSPIYTPIDQLSAEDRVQFEAARFTAGKIPTKPPPRELV